MKRKLAVIFVCIFLVGLFPSCGKHKITESTIELNKKGVITETSFEDFSQSYYDESELETYVQSEVDTYNGGESSDVKVDELKVKDGVATLVMEYKDYSAYKSFMGVTCYSGSILQAQTAGFKFDTDFISADSDSDEEGSLSAEAENYVDTSEVLSDDDLKVFIVQTDSDIIVPGKIKYVSAVGTHITSSDTVTVDKKENPSETRDVIYILYK